MRLLAISFLFITTVAFSQEIEVKGQFHEDSIKIGVSVPYSLAVTYPSDQTVLFPDSSFNFSPFEIDHKIFFPTKSSGSLSHDSVVYYLTSFEIDSVQTLGLPIFVVQPADCTAIYARGDTVFLKHLVAHPPDSVTIEQLPLKVNTAYQAVKWLLNYPLLLIIGGVLLVAVIIIWIVFGKKIRVYFLLLKLKKNHNKFLTEFSQAIENLQSSYSNRKAESTLSLWKQYMEHLLASPVTKFTSKEIFNLVKDEQLAHALRQIDKTIYRESQSISLEPLQELQRFSEQQFSLKVQEVRNG